jgi:hypothetical protein
MATLYVRKEGVDTANGSTIALAKLTITSAMTAAAHNDTINIGVGAWYGTFGTSGKRIVYQGAGMFDTTIIGAFYISDSPAFYDLTIQMNVNQQNAYSGAYFNRVRVFGNGFGSPQSYWLYTDNKSFTAINSIFHNIIGSQSYLIYTAGATTTFNHCVIYRGGFLHSGGALVIKNSILDLCDLSNLPTTFIHENNIWYNNGSNPAGFTLNATELKTNPLFVDRIGGVMSVRDGSPAINLGVAT